MLTSSQLQVEKAAAPAWLSLDGCQTYCAAPLFWERYYSGSLLRNQAVQSAETSGRLEVSHLLLTQKKPIKLCPVCNLPTRFLGPTVPGDLGARAVLLLRGGRLLPAQPELRDHQKVGVS